MAYWHISHWMKKIYSDVVWDKRDDNRSSVYLTFDDGPTPGVTEKVLDILDRYDAKGTFFCLGRNVERHPELYKEIIRRGHAVGNHTYSHLRGWGQNDDEYINDVELAAQHIDSSLFRPPYGRIRRSQIKKLKEKYTIILWDIMSHDYENRVSKEHSLKAVLRYTRAGSIVVFHDSLKAWNKLQYVLPAVMEEFRAKGYGFEKLI